MVGLVPKPFSAPFHRVRLGLLDGALISGAEIAVDAVPGPQPLPGDESTAGKTTTQTALFLRLGRKQERIALAAACLCSSRCSLLSATSFV